MLSDTPLYYLNVLKMDEYKINPPYKAEIVSLRDGKTHELAGEWWKADKDFRHCFGISLRAFHDGITTIVFEKVSINPFKFDDYLHDLYGNYEDENKTLEDIILEKYGEEALKLIKELL
ncbi:hypothetical protein EZS27_004708 [termite gut metagenome]|uniref:Uncharacterized protein n=1 Tax=termite gut metagenome TaxID=433724 RepID=A0A5J4SR43_9ZZZZ